MDALVELEQVIGRVAERLAPSVVGVGQQGSGVVVAPGLVATNAHNVRGGEVEVTFADGRSVAGAVAGADPDVDLAVIRVETGDAPAADWADAAPALGAVVFGVANPGGRGTRATVGTVSAVGRPFRGPRGRRIEGSLEHTAPLARGSSGAPLADAEGRVVGINTHRVDDGFYLAQPADAGLRDRLTALGRGEVPFRPRLGVAVVPGHVARRLRAAVGLEPRDGLLVRAVEEGGPADRAGVRGGDLIVEVGGAAVTSPDDLHRALESAVSGAMAVKLIRGSDEVTVSVDLSGGGARQEGSA